jgi:hypothetical protein
MNALTQTEQHDSLGIGTIPRSLRRESHSSGHVAFDA